MKKIRFRGTWYDLDSMSENDKAIMAKEIAEQYPEPKIEEKKEFKKYKKEDE